MKILLVSDTHKITAKLKDEILPQYANEVQMAIHLGDYVRDLLSLQSSYPNLKMVGVGGAFESGEKTEQLLEFDTDGGCRRILIMHGHTQLVKHSLLRTKIHAKRKGVNACFFGHTHTAVTTTEDGIFYMNPGSLTNPRGTPRGSFGLVSISTTGEISGEVIFV